MGDKTLTLSGFTSTPSRTVLTRARLRVRRWIRRHRQHESLSDLSDWILRDIGVNRERDLGTGREADPREEARQFWLR
jgi:uncharacterized protein YjiS (DUF1127 family)